MRAAPALMLGLLRKFRLVRLELRGRVGLDDPADTGMVFGVLEAVRHLPMGARVQIDVRPDFHGARFEGRAGMTIRVVPILLFGPMLGVAWRVFVVPS